MTNSPVGREIDRVDGRLKVTGAAEYSSDYPAAGTAHAYMVTSTVGLGRIRTMDTAAALAAPGVLTVYSPFNPLRLYTETGAVENYVPLQDGDLRVRFRGQVIAMVVAETYEQARDAAALVTTTYDAEPPRTSLEDGPSVPANPSFDGHPPSSTVLAPGVGSIDEALAASAVVVERTYRQPVQNHVAMEPHATLAVWRDDELTVYSGSQMSGRHMTSITHRLGVSPDQVRVITRYVGGGFGSRVRAWNDVVLAAAAARALDRPVKLVLSREQVFTVVGHRGQIDQTIRLGAARDGVLNVVTHESNAEMPVVGGWNMLPAAEVSAVLYRTPNLHVDQRMVMLDLPPTWAMRGPNETPGAFALETAMDELAVATAVDPLELRLRNYAAVVPGTDMSWSSKHLDECYRVGAERFGWSARPSTPRSRTDGQWLVGIGMATAIYPAGRNAASVRVRLHDDNTAVVSTATADLGTGAWTVLTITGADALGIPLRRVTPRLGDSALPLGAAAVGSGATASTVPAVQAAARDTIAALVELAVTSSRSPWYGADPADLQYDNGRLRSADRAMTFGQLLSTIGVAGVEATTTAEPDEDVENAFHSFGAHFCEVRVNRFTGEPRVTRFTTVVDVGRVVNAKATRSQIVGGVIFGIGHSLLEHNPVERDTGRMAAGNLADYMVPVNADIPDIDVHWLDRPDTVISDFGARGVGELGTVGAGAAVGNAIFNATGVRVRDVPITLDKLL